MLFIVSSKEIEILSVELVYSNSVFLGCFDRKLDWESDLNMISCSTSLLDITSRFSSIPPGMSYLL
jgi:hypothetical protein